MASQFKHCLYSIRKNSYFASIGFDSLFYMSFLLLAFALGRIPRPTEVSLSTALFAFFMLSAFFISVLFIYSAAKFFALKHILAREKVSAGGKVRFLPFVWLNTKIAFVWMTLLLVTSLLLPGIGQLATARNFGFMVITALIFVVVYSAHSHFFDGEKRLRTSLDFLFSHKGRKIALLGIVVFFIFEILIYLLARSIYIIIPLAILEVFFWLYRHEFYCTVSRQ